MAIFQIVVVLHAVFITPTGLSIEREFQEVKNAQTFDTRKECGEALIGDNRDFGALGAKLRKFIRDADVPDDSFLRSAIIRLRCQIPPVVPLADTAE